MSIMLLVSSERKIMGIKIDDSNTALILGRVRFEVTQNGIPAEIWYNLKRVATIGERCSCAVGDSFEFNFDMNRGEVRASRN